MTMLRIGAEAHILGDSIAARVARIRAAAKGQTTTVVIARAADEADRLAEEAVLLAQQLRHEHLIATQTEAA